jgi:hypothetical protein
MMAKQMRRTPGTTAHTQKPGKEMLLKTEHLRPGDCVSIDQYTSPLKGRLKHTKGKEKDDDKYCGGTIFVDHASGLIFNAHQISLRTGETLNAKLRFEHLARAHGITIKRYHADNTPFGSQNLYSRFKSRIKKSSSLVSEHTTKMV